LRTLFFSDVHGNLEALEAVLADAAMRGYEAAVCLGDIVGYAADPEACVRIVSSIPGISAVLGNHDAAVLEPECRPYLNPVAQAGVRYAERTLSPESVRYLRSLPVAIESGDGYVAVHSSPYKPEEWCYVLEPMEALDALRAMTLPIAFIGHTHYPAVHDRGGAMLPFLPGQPVVFQPGEKYVVNVGSVGQPRDGDPRSAYTIFDGRARTAEVFRVEYDVDAAALKILEAGLPAMLADRIRRGY
jgi:diadenosine tetraphosphatase ApaH/serine/threonine PP2A family protein phosphatase